MLQVTTWVVLADNTTARFLENHGSGTGLHQLSGMLLTSEKKEPYSDDEGRIRAPGGDDPIRPEKHIEHEPEVERFANTLVEVLSKAQSDKKFDRLILSAAPSMLGLLRNKLPSSVVNTIRGEYNKNLINVPTDSVGSHFSDVIKL